MMMGRVCCKCMSTARKEGKEIMIGWMCCRCHEVVGRCHAAAGCFDEAKASFDTALNINLKLFGAVQVRNSRERGAHAAHSDAVVKNDLKEARVLCTALGAVILIEVD